MVMFQEIKNFRDLSLMHTDKLLVLSGRDFLREEVGCWWAMVHLVCRFCGISSCVVVVVRCIVYTCRKDGRFDFWTMCFCGCGHDRLGILILVVVAYGVVGPSKGVGIFWFLCVVRVLHQMMMWWRIPILCRFWYWSVDRW